MDYKVCEDLKTLQLNTDMISLFRTLMKPFYPEIYSILSMISLLEPEDEGDFAG